MGGADGWSAIARGVDPAEVARANQTAREDFLASGLLPAAVRGLVAASWRRSLDLGLRPDGSPPPVDLTDSDLDAYRSAHPLAAVMPVVRRLLVADAADEALLVAVTDAEGRLLWVDGSSALRSRAEQMHSVEGALWSEREAGTNAPGTALAVDHALQIFGAEHLASPVTAWSCSAAPVHGPDGSLVGALDITGGPEAVAPHALRLVTAAAAAVEAELRLRHLERLSAVSARAGVPVLAPLATAAAGRPSALAVLGRSHGLLQVGGSARHLLLRQRHGELLLLLAEHPDGLTAEQLEAALHEDRSAVVTARAEVSRLRSTLTDAGGPAIDSRPYRLRPVPATDVAAVRGWLDAGDVSDALVAYTGPVLPLSQAPGVARVRDRLHHRVRDAVLGSGDPELVWELAQRPEQAFDLELWEACLRGFPPGSTRHGTVQRRVEQLHADLG